LAQFLAYNRRLKALVMPAFLPVGWNRQGDRFPEPEFGERGPPITTRNRSGSDRDRFPPELAIDRSVGWLAQLTQAVQV